ncbi:Crp/Fnr family transcriptional regulator [Paenibacillus guangzhouensis]|uniref:Crp/Fnr family transcriptional regulator n=1 Tax=Paenibacillus guangzhouensis TaxID=1473112 RepID=UPI001267657A|nr:Crp/Fnr family transcriptional regulator [Paenibacillus guangzhouensis]
MDRIQYLSQFNLLHSLSREDLVEMDELTSITIFPKHTYIQTPDSFKEGLYFIKQGKVRLFKLNSDGKQFTSDILCEGNVFGEMKFIALGTRDHYIETIEESHICLMNKDRFENYLMERPRFMMNMIQVLSDRIAQMSHLTQNLALGNLHDKILYIIKRLANQFGYSAHDAKYVRIAYALSHQEIANLVGATREAVTTALQELVKDGMIQTGFKTIYLHRSQLDKL